MSQIEKPDRGNVILALEKLELRKGKTWYESRSLRVAAITVISYLILRFSSVLGAPEVGVEDAYILASILLMALIRLDTRDPIVKRKAKNIKAVK
jgi:hypothetical protein